MRLTSDVVKRFWSFVNKTEDENSCWLWTGSLNKERGYGQLRVRKNIRSSTIYLAHRISFQLHGNAIPQDLDVCHSCNNKACVNPKHLYLGTRSQNMLDASRDGLLPRGKERHNFVTTSEFKIEVVRLRKQGLTQKEIGNILGVSQQHISSILNGKHGLERAWFNPDYSQRITEQKEEIAKLFNSSN